VAIGESGELSVVQLAFSARRALRVVCSSRDFFELVFYRQSL